MCFRSRTNYEGSACLTRADMRPLQGLITEIRAQEERIKKGGGADAIDRQHKKKRLTARERIARLIDAPAAFFELGLWAAWKMYEEWGGAPSAGVVTGIGTFAPRHTITPPHTAPATPPPSSPPPHTP